jgi:hypothetical protein
VSCNASAQYDIDVTCGRNSFINMDDPHDPDIERFSCTEGEGTIFSFRIQCEKNTVQRVESTTYYCKTADGQNVRIRVVQ